MIVSDVDRVMEGANRPVPQSGSGGKKVGKVGVIRGHQASHDFSG